MDSDQFSQALLRKARLKARIFHIVPDAAEHLTVVHTALQSMFRNVLTPYILSVNIPQRLE